MNLYLIIVVLVGTTVAAFSQECPASTTINGQQFTVVHLGNQCFYVDATSNYLTGQLNTFVGYVPNVRDVLAFSDLASVINSVNITTYGYSRGPNSSTCSFQETISMVIELGFSLSGSHPQAQNFVTSGVLQTTVNAVRQHQILVGANGTTLPLTSQNVTFPDPQITIEHSVFNPLTFPDPKSFIRNDLMEELTRFINFQIFSPQPSFIHKLNDQILSIDTEIDGPSIVCNQPITLSLTNNYQGMWVPGGFSNSIVVSNPGMYNVEVNDVFCNKKTLAKTITQAPGIPSDFITVEPLCSSKIKLSAGEFLTTHWSTNATTSSIEVDQSGSYSAMVTDGNGCMGTDNIQLNLNPPCQPNNTIVAPLNIAAICSDFPNLLRRWKITNPNSSPIRMDWEIAGTIQKTWLDVPPGDSYLSAFTVPQDQNLLKVYWHDEKGQMKSLQLASTTLRCQKGASSSSFVAGGKFETELKVFPNPAKGQFVLEVPSDDERLVPLQILSASGVVWYTGTVQLGSGQNFITNDVSRFDNGAYVIKIGNETVRFVKE